MTKILIAMGFVLLTVTGCFYGPGRGYGYRGYDRGNERGYERGHEHGEGRGGRGG